MRRRSAASASRARITSFSLTRSSARAASHSSAVTTGGVFMVGLLSTRVAEDAWDLFIELLLPAFVEAGAIGRDGLRPPVVTHAQPRAVALGRELERHLRVTEPAGPPA